MNIHDPRAPRPHGPKANGHNPDRSVHPGSGRRKTREFPRGRQPDEQSVDEVRALLGDRSRAADLLIEHLHLLQDRYGCLHARHLVALANEMRLALVEVYEVASFYAHFDIVMEDEPPPPPCMGGCHNAPVVAIGHSLHEHATIENVTSAVQNGHTHPHVPEYPDLERYRAAGGYKLLSECLEGKRPVEDIIKTLEDSNLRGLGGAGFPTGRKWRFVRAEPAPRLMAINGDEGEPGTFKDRHYLETDPHRFLEGMLWRRKPSTSTCGTSIRSAAKFCCAKFRSCRLQVSPATLKSTFAVAPAPTSAAKNRRCWSRSKASAACPGTSRPSRAK
jgi:formate dehydrogenase